MQGQYHNLDHISPSTFSILNRIENSFIPISNIIMRLIIEYLLYYLLSILDRELQ